jgi:hypothetical protein
MGKLGCAIIIVAVVVAAIIFCPLLTIWCINTLWDVNNPYDFWHWLAALLVGGSVLGALFGGSSSKRSK